ncbi:MAG: SWIM zinc finger family protein [Bacteroidota bacterium]
MNLTEDQILSLAPDDSAKKSGKELANFSKWGKLNVSSRALWGECQGSGKLPYQTQVDLQSIAFKCSCPSRKFPCKHGLGLLTLYARDRQKFSSADEPDWVTAWLDKRNEREEKKAEKKVREGPVDEVAQAKRQQNRMKRIESGLEELTLWMKDMIRNGIIDIPGRDPSHFENMARRMVDAQAPGLATMVRELANVNMFQDGWQTPFLDQLARMFLVANGISRLPTLSPEWQYELRTQVGIAQDQEELKLSSSICDKWLVLAKQSVKEEALTTERNWLYGINSGKYALVLQFYVKGQVPELNLLPGSALDADMVFFKGVCTLRALVKENRGVSDSGLPVGFNSWTEVLIEQASVSNLTPLHNQLPAIVNNVTPLYSDGHWFLRDEFNEGVRLNTTNVDPWKLMAISGGAPVKLFVMGREQIFTALGVWIENQYILL